MLFPSQVNILETEVTTATRVAEIPSVVRDSPV
jgi:hypothetical protein